MYRILAAFFLLVASVATSSAQGFVPAVWQNQQGSLLKVLASDPATGRFAGVYINYGGICPGAPYDVSGATRGVRIGFQAWRAYSPFCKSTTVWHGRMVNPTTIVATWVMTYVDASGVTRRARGADTFRRI